MLTLLGFLDLSVLLLMGLWEGGSWVRIHVVLLPDLTVLNSGLRKAPFWGKSKLSVLAGLSVLWELLDLH